LFQFVIGRSWLLLKVLAIAVEFTTAQVIPRQLLQRAVGQGEAEDDIAVGVLGVEEGAVAVEAIPAKDKANDVAGAVAKKASE